MEDVHSLLPRHKSDTARAAALVALGYPAIAPVLPRLIEWLQDMNWPVAQVLVPLLASIGPPVAPLVRDVLAGNDTMWKYWLLYEVVAASPPVYHLVRDQVLQLASTPPQDEDEAAVQEAALSVLEHYGEAQHA